MTEFNRLFFEMMDGIGSAGENYDDWNLQQMGITKKDYVSPPKSTPLSHAKPPEIYECPHCGFKRQVEEILKQIAPSNPQSK